MPYEIAQVNGRWIVRKEGGGRVFGKHPTRAAALRQLRALYANEPKAKP